MSQSPEKIINYIYLLQTREFINTNKPIYKVGKTKLINYGRFNQYPKGSILLLQSNCYNCDVIEKIIINEFKEKFKQRLEIGLEYFEGDYIKMKQIINLTIDKYIKDSIANKDQAPDNNLIGIETQISTLFPNYKKDESFGGTKKFIKISPDANNNYIIFYIKNNINVYNGYSFYGDIISSYVLDKNSIDKLVYFNFLLNKNKIILEEVYDINSNIFINKVNKTKKKIDVEHYDIDIIKEQDKDLIIKQKLIELFNCDTIINHKLYVITSYLYSSFNINNSNNMCIQVEIANIQNANKQIILYNITNRYYEYETYVRKYLPFMVRWNANNDYYILNIDKEYIGVDNNVISDTIIGEHVLTRKIETYRSIPMLWYFYRKTIEDFSLINCLNSNSYTSSLYIQK
jgi:hypothetical protein